MLCDTHALSNYTGIITLLTETLKLVHHHHFRTCSRAPGKYHCVYSVCFFCVHTKLKKTAESSLFYVPPGSDLSPHWFCVALADAAVTQWRRSSVCDLGRLTQSKYCAVWSLCAHSCSQQATFYMHFTNVYSASSKNDARHSCRCNVM